MGLWVDRLGLAVMGVGKVGSWGGTYARGSGTTRDTHGSRGDEGYKIVRVVGWTATAAWLKAAGLERMVWVVGSGGPAKSGGVVW